MANIYQCRLRLCGESDTDGAHDIKPLIDQLGPNCDWSATSTPAIDSFLLAFGPIMGESSRDFLERWQTLPPEYSESETTGKWSKCTDAEIKSVIQPIINEYGWGEETGLENKGNDEDWIDYELPQMWEITFGSIYSPPFKAFEIIVDETIDLFQAYLAFEDSSMGNCGRWECYTGGEESGVETEYVRYTNDKGELLSTYRMPKSDWQLVEEIWTEIHGPDELKLRIKYAEHNWKWIPVNKRFTTGDDGLLPDGEWHKTKK